MSYNALTYNAYISKMTSEIFSDVSDYPNNSVEIRNVIRVCSAIYWDFSMYYEFLAQFHI